MILVFYLQISLFVISQLFTIFCFFKQKTAYDMRISDWSSDVCSSDLIDGAVDEVRLLLEREAVAGRHGIAGCVAERLALALPLGIEGEHLVAGLRQGAGRPEVHVLRALDRAGRDDHRGVRPGLAVRPKAPGELGACTRPERHGDGRHSSVAEPVRHRTHRTVSADGGG